MFACLFAHQRYLAPLAVVVSVAVVLTVHPVWAATGLDVWNVPALRESMASSEEHGRVLTAADEEIRQRIEVKEQLIAELITGRTTLAEVVSAFLILNRDRPECMSAIRKCYPGATDEEKLARNVLDFTLARLRAELPTRQTEVRTRLEAEFQQLAGDAASETR